MERSGLVAEHLDLQSSESHSCPHEGTYFLQRKMFAFKQFSKKRLSVTQDDIFCLTLPENRPIRALRSRNLDADLKGANS